MNPLAAWLEHAATVTPQATALIVGDERVSFAVLVERSRGGEPADGVRTVVSASSKELAFAAYASAVQGRLFFPLNANLPPQRLHALQEQCCAPAPDASASPVVWMIATSGSGGEPRCVMLSGENLAAAVQAAHTRVPLAAGDVWLDCLPLFHVGGLSILARCAAAGATVLLHEGFDAERVWNDLAQGRATHLSLVPAMLARLLEVSCAAPPPETLRHVLIGGGALSRALALRARDSGWPLRPTYGMSETASQIATLREVPADWVPGCVGQPLPGMTVEIVDERGQPTDGEGIVRVYGAALMAGYANPAGRRGEGLQENGFLSGDRGYFDAHGNLVILGRRDEVLVSGGSNVHPAEIEEVLIACPGVADIAVTALADEIWGERLVALFVGEAEGETLRDWCQSRLRGLPRPRQFVRVACLPRNALGKLIRRDLPALAAP